jgi:pilus assembly protein Flp/PilA
MPYGGLRGQGLVEYALLILLVAIAILVVLTLFGMGVGNMFSNIVANV